MQIPPALLFLRESPRRQLIQGSSLLPQVLIESRTLTIAVKCLSGIFSGNFKKVFFVFALPLLYLSFISFSLIRFILG